MNTDQLIENLHKENEQQKSLLQQALDRVNEEWTQAIQVVALCAKGPHLIENKIGPWVRCKSTCPTCIAERFMSNSLTEEDLKLVKGEK